MTSVKLFKIGKFDLNPRGNLWLEDESTFGHKLLSKMGWSKGQGLGKNNNGISESIKVRMKNGNTGVGWKEQIPLGIDTQEYDSILSNLSKRYKGKLHEKSSQPNGSGLEHRSQQFKNRMHYRKFVRGKDICRYSDKDMKSIFLKSKVDCAEPAAVNDMPQNEESESPCKDNSVAPLPTYNSGMSLADYFASKLKTKAGTNSKADVPPVPPQNDDECAKTQNGELLSIENSVPTKKRKKHREDTHISKKAKLQDEDSEPTTEIINSTENELNEEITINEPSNLKNDSPAKRRKVSKKSKNVNKLKSCIKKYVAKFIDNKRNVSFNEEISYRTIESRYDNEVESVDCIEGGSLDNDISILKCNGEESSENIICLNSNANESDKTESPTETAPLLSETCSSMETTTDINVIYNLASTDDEMLENIKCLELPKSDKLNYNSWLESQRQATKMKLYKNMIKNIKKNSVLRTTNLLDIKGYGNW